MTNKRELTEAVEYFSLEEKRLNGMFKVYWLMMFMGVASICFYIWGCSQAKKLADYSEEITQTVSPKTTEETLTVVDAKIDLLRSELKVTQNYTPLYLGGILIGSGIGYLLSHKRKLKNMEILKNAILHIQKNS